jgi:transcriptional regulator
VYVSPRFPVDDPRHAVRLVRDHPFALVISAEDGVPVATHAPVILESPVDTSFVGATLLGHLARANRQWRGWEAAPDALLVFSGPHGYVSPTTYATDPAVPTWDYAAVHLTGRICSIPDPAQTLDVVSRTVQVVESGRSPSWVPSPASRERFAAIVGGVMAFRFRVTAERSVFKLSQDGDEERRHRVRRDVLTGPYANPGLAHLMNTVDPL